MVKLNTSLTSPYNLTLSNSFYYCHSLDLIDWYRMKLLAFLVAGRKQFRTLFGRLLVQLWDVA